MVTVKTESCQNKACVCRNQHQTSLQPVCVNRNQTDVKVSWLLPESSQASLRSPWFKMIKHCIKQNKSHWLPDKFRSTHHKPAVSHSLTAACYTLRTGSAGRTRTGFCVLLNRDLIAGCVLLKTGTTDGNCKEAWQRSTAGDCRAQNEPTARPHATDLS